MASISKVGQYFIEVWKACGMKMDRVKFLWTSDEIARRGEEYWVIVPCPGIAYVVVLNTLSFARAWCSTSRPSSR